MSRVGKNPVAVPSGVTVAVDGRMVTAKGKLGELKLNLGDQVTAKLQDGKLVCAPVNDTKKARMQWGTTRNLMRNMVQGVSQGFKKNLEINGVGYRAAVQGKTLQLQLGYSHDVIYPIPEGIKVTEKGKRKGREISWRSIISGDAQLAEDLKISIDAMGG